jgi:Flp pilus assembly protein TadD
VLPVRAEPYEILSYCLSRERRNQQAVAMMKRAIARDPHDWELLYGLALVRGAGGENPRGAARRALRLNPREQLVQAVVAGFAHGGPRDWRRTGRSAPLPFP